MSSQIRKNTAEHSLLSARQLTCIREERLLFEALELSINAGDIIQVEGANGSGKTSLLRILAGLSTPYEGEVLFQGCAIDKEVEHYHQHLLYLGPLHGINADLAETTLSEVNLLGFEDALASHLSAGQHRRIALARLWQSHHKIWILDEPFTAIDKRGVAKLEQLFLKHTDNGGCIILTTHQDLTLASERIKKVSLAYQFY